MECLPILNLLNESFVSSWALVKEVQDVIDNDTLSVEERDFGRLAMDAYSFPVESMVIDPASKTVTHRVNANELMDEGVEGLVSSVKLTDPLDRAYYNFLQKGMTQ